MSFVTIFNLILTVATLVTGIVWLIDVLWLARQRGPDGKRGPVVDFFAGLFPVIAAVFVLRSFVYEPFRIPSGSMLPTLNIGDFILVDKFHYGLRCPVGQCKLVEVGEPKRGDVVVFRYPGPRRDDPNFGNDFIKRVIGTPGDRIEYRGKTLTINGEVQAQANVGVGYEDGLLQRRQETLNGVGHSIQVVPGRTLDPFSCPFVKPNGDDFAFTVPEGQFFMMGDNRDGSNDSRCWGTVPEANLKGRAVLIWLNFDFGRMRGDVSRIGTVVH